MQDTLDVKKMKRDSYVIVNVDKMSQPGSHWCAVYKGVSGKIVYIYDSFGRNIKKLMPLLYNRIVKSGYKIITPDEDPEQDKSSFVCGVLSIAWLKLINNYGIENALYI